MRPTGCAHLLLIRNSPTCNQRNRPMAVTHTRYSRYTPPARKYGNDRALRPNTLLVASPGSVHRMAIGPYHVTHSSGVTKHVARHTGEHRPETYVVGPRGSGTVGGMRTRCPHRQIVPGWVGAQTKIIRASCIALYTCTARALTLSVPRRAAPQPSIIVGTVHRSRAPCRPRT